MKLDLKGGSPFPNLSTSITDISFLLTIFFVIAAVFIADLGIFVSLPRRDNAARVLSPEEAVSIAVAGDGISLEGKPTALAALPEAIRALLPAKRDPVAVVVVAAGVRYQTVLDVVEKVKLGGLATFSLSMGKAAGAGGGP
jgi:biopolymer transport protein ExbD